jgi:hypothetical protein
MEAVVVVVRLQQAVRVLVVRVAVVRAVLSPAEMPAALKVLTDLVVVAVDALSRTRVLRPHRVVPESSSLDTRLMVLIAYLPQALAETRPPVAFTPSTPLLRVVPSTL